MRCCDIHIVTSVQLLENGEKLPEIEIIKLLYEKDTDGYNFPWNAETYYFDDSKGWMIYVSHEGTITFAGDRLKKAAIENIDSQYIYL